MSSISADWIYIKKGTDEPFEGKLKFISTDSIRNPGEFVLYAFLDAHGYKICTCANETQPLRGTPIPLEVYSRAHDYQMQVLLHAHLHVNFINTKRAIKSIKNRFFDTGFISFESCYA